MAKSDFLEEAYLRLVFLGTAIANIADNAGTAPATDYYFSLHTASPGEAGDQTSNEAVVGDYTNYSRVAVARGAGGWSVSGPVASLAADVVFAPALSGDAATYTHWALGKDASGAGEILYHGALSVPITLAEALEPKIKAGSTITES